MKYFIPILILFILLGCHEKKDDIATNTARSYHAVYCDIGKTDSLKRKIELGDTASYEELREIYTLSSHYEEFLTFAVRMAEDYHYHNAYFDAYLCLIAGKPTQKQKLSIDLADYYLIKAYELGNKAAKENILYRFGDNAFNTLPSSKEQWLKIQNNR